MGSDLPESLVRFLIYEMLKLWSFKKTITYIWLRLNNSNCYRMSVIPLSIQNVILSMNICVNLLFNYAYINRGDCEWLEFMKNCLNQ